MNIKKIGTTNICSLMLWAYMLIESIITSDISKLKVNAILGSMMAILYVANTVLDRSINNK